MLSNSISKHYDMVLSVRFNRWFNSYLKEADSQDGKECFEYIVTLHLFCDVESRYKFELFVTFVDFSQAYGKVQYHMMSCFVLYNV